MSTRFLISAALAYGRGLPAHPGKWRVIDALTRGASGQVSARVDGFQYDLDLRDFVSRGVYFGTFEPLERQMVRRLVQPGWTVLDVGANIGVYSLLLSRLVGPKGHVYAFEPEATIFGTLCAHLKINNAHNVTPCALAIGDRVGETGFQRHGENNLGKSHIGQTGATVQMSTIDAVVQEHRISVDFIKMDIEGAEMMAVRGAQRTIEQHRPALMIEINPSALASLGSSAESLTSHLRNLGYQLRVPGWRGLHPLQEPVTREYLNALCTYGSELR